MSLYRQKARKNNMCAVFGLIDYGRRLSTKAKEKILKVLSRECEARGTDATGYAFNNGGRLTIFKRPMPARKLKLRLPDNVNVVMGHTRMATQGNQLLNYNNHPFTGRAGLQQFALAHNGVLTNDYRLHKDKVIPETMIETDSYAAVQLIEKGNYLGFDSIRTMAETLKGSFVFTILDEDDSLYFVRGSNPLTIYDFYNDGFCLYASTKDILANTMKKLGIYKRPKSEIEVKEGDILKIDCFGETEKSFFEYDDFDNWYINWCSRKTANTVCDDLYDIARSFGIDENCINQLYCYGYTTEEIEELLYEPDELMAVMEMLDYEFCF